jgi:predicted acyl esterase
MLDNDPHNAPRMDFLQKLSQWSTNLSDEMPDKAKIGPWTHEQMTRMSTMLKAPTKDEQQLLISLAKMHGGLGHLKYRWVASAMFLLSFSA